MYALLILSISALFKSTFTNIYERERKKVRKIVQENFTFSHLRNVEGSLYSWFKNVHSDRFVNNIFLDLVK